MPPLDANDPARSTDDRQFYLDWLRILAFALLVVFHVGMYYVTWEWHVKSPFASPAVEPWMRLSSPWRMDLLFLVSGAATAFMFGRSGVTPAMLRARAARLLWPLLFGVLVVVPPQSYLEVIRRFAFDGSYLDFLALYLRPWSQGHQFCERAGACLILPTWNHLWYLPYLFCYTALLWVALRLRPDLLERLAATLVRTFHGAGWLVWPLAWLVGTRLLLAWRLPVTHALVDDWFAHAQYLPMFLLGTALARGTGFALRLQAQRWQALGLALGGWLLLEAMRAHGGAERDWLWVPGSVLYSASQWGALVAALGFARRHLNVDHAARRYLSEAVFPLYLLHQTVIIVVAQAWRGAGWHPALEAGGLIGVTLALGFLAFEALRRMPVLAWLRPFMGLKPVDQAVRAGRWRSAPRST